MTFWGVEIKPGKPYTHRYDETRGRLRVTQATLGNPVKAKDANSAVKLSRTTVQCNVGEKSPVLICILVSDKCETCSMDLEFEEQEEVVFSVLGQTSVHLTGYYVGSRDGTIEPIGEDIAETESEDSDFDDFSDEDEYESDFIDDGDDIEMYDDDDDNKYPPSRPHKSGVVIEEIIDEEKPSNGDKIRLAKKKNLQVSDSDDAAGEFQSQFTVVPASIVQVDSEDEDGFPISESKKNEVTKEETKKRKIDDSVPEGVEKEEDNEVSKKKKKLDKKSKKTEKSKKESKAEDIAEENAPKDGSKKPEEGTKEEPTKVDAELETPISKKITEIENGQSVDTSESKKKKKKKKIKKNKESGEKDQGKTEENKEKDEEKEAQQARTFGNGLVVEEISMGRPDGKKANPGSKIFVNYIGKLQNGKIFDSNVGQRPFKFRLGVGQVIKGWDVGVNGMRVGDKRRLTIPPSMGYGDKAVGKIPKNSWLIFDVELINVQ